MTISEILQYCMNKTGAEQSVHSDWKATQIKVADVLFAMVKDVEGRPAASLKTSPELADLLSGGCLVSAGHRVAAGYDPAATFSLRTTAEVSGSARCARLRTQRPFLAYRRQGFHRRRCRLQDPDPQSSQRF